jgi:hypothetical protein
MRGWSTAAWERSNGAIPPATVSPDGATITLNLLSEPPVKLQLTDDGHVRAAP